MSVVDDITYNFDDWSADIHDDDDDDDNAFSDSIKFEDDDMSSPSHEDVHSTTNSIDEQVDAKGSQENRPTSGKTSKRKSSTVARSEKHQKHPNAVGRRNERERNRVKQVNLGFDRLRQYVRIPGLIGAKKKLSKVDTLRAAVDYITRLQQLLELADAAAETVSPKASTPTVTSFADAIGCDRLPSPEVQLRQVENAAQSSPQADSKVMQQMMPTSPYQAVDCQFQPSSGQQQQQPEPLIIEPSGASIHLLPRGYNGPQQQQQPQSHAQQPELLQPVAAAQLQLQQAQLLPRLNLSPTNTSSAPAKVNFDFFQMSSSADAGVAAADNVGSEFLYNERLPISSTPGQFVQGPRPEALIAVAESQSYPTKNVCANFDVSITVPSVDYNSNICDGKMETATSMFESSPWFFGPGFPGVTGSSQVSYCSELTDGYALGSPFYTRNVSDINQHVAHITAWLMTEY